MRNIEVGKRYKLNYSASVIFLFGELKGYIGSGLCISDKEKGSSLYLFSELKPKVEGLEEFWFHSDNIGEEIG